MLPYTPEIYLQLFAPYNQIVWPIQPLFAVGFIAALVFSIRHNNIGGRLFSVLLAISYILLGLVFYWGFLFDLLWLAPVLAVFCAAQAMLLLWFGVIRNTLKINIDENIATITGLLLIILATAYYPMISILKGGDLVLSQYAGLAPLPTLLLTVGFFLTSFYTVPVWLIIIPAILVVVEGTHNYLLNQSGGLVITAATILGLFYLITCIAIRKKAKPGSL